MYGIMQYTTGQIHKPKYMLHSAWFNRASMPATTAGCDRQTTTAQQRYRCQEGFKSTDIILVMDVFFFFS